MKNPEKLLDLLAQDARLTPAQLAAMLGETEEDVAAAIKAYEKNSTILGYKTVVDWDKTSKESVTALIEVKITPQKVWALMRLPVRSIRTIRWKACI